MNFGDFNCYIDHNLDKLPPVTTVQGAHRTALRNFMEEVDWIDPWRNVHPGERIFSCFSKMHASLSRIDLCLCSPMVERYVSDITYALRGILDHSSILVSTMSTSQPASWALNAVWLNLLPAPDNVKAKMSDNWQTQVEH